MFGRLIPQGGGDPIPMLKKTLHVGRRESCDIVLRFPNVSAHHCELFVEDGYWYVRDSQSRNGIKVNGQRVEHKRLDPGDELAVAKHKYEIQYSPADLGALGPPPAEEPAMPAMLGRSLLERAGLVKKSKMPEPSRPTSGEARRSRYDDHNRIDIMKSDAGQLKSRDPNEPV